MLQREVQAEYEHVLEYADEEYKEQGEQQGARWVMMQQQRENDFHGTPHPLRYTCGQIHCDSTCILCD
jgi:hypothetical protein